MTTPRPVADVVMLGGRLVLVVDAHVTGALAALLDQALGARRRLGQRTPVEAYELLTATRAAHAAAFLDLVPMPVPNVDPGTGPGAPWITTQQAAASLGISQRAVVKRLSAGTLAGSKAAGRWLVHLDPGVLSDGLRLLDHHPR